MKIDSDKLQQSIQSVNPWVRWIETFIRPRLAWLCRGPARYFTAVLVIALALTMYPLELIPFGVSVPAFALCIFALGITAHDGVLVIIGWVLSATSLFFAYKMFL